MIDYNSEDDDQEGIPLHHQRAFGAGVKRKRIEFVRQSDPTENLTATTSSPKESVGDLYLSIVGLSKKPKPGEEVVEGCTPSADSHVASGLLAASAPALLGAKTSICAICNYSTAGQTADQHASSLAHQLSQPHSHPPSNIDRASVGYTYMSSYGYDADARVGLGASGLGRLHPVRAVDREAKDKLGIGAIKEEKVKVKKETLDAGKVRKMETQNKKKEKRMRDLMYGNDEVNKYLGLEL
jgi:hypothetical protein